jgi:hypothetical protein
MVILMAAKRIHAGREIHANGDDAIRFPVV